MGEVLGNRNLKALIIGGARGIGRAVASHLIADGVDLVFTSLSGRQSTKEELNRLRVTDHQIIEQLVLDVRNAVEIEVVIGQTERILNGLDYLVYSPGGALVEPMGEVDSESWEEMLSIHCIGASFAISKAQKSLKNSGMGSVVLISSISSLSARPNQLAYSSAKAAMNQVMRSYALKLAEDGVRVNSVLPGLIASAALDSMPRGEIEAVISSTPLKRLGTVDEIANCVTFLLSPKASFVTGHSFVASGGR